MKIIFYIFLYFILIFFINSSNSTIICNENTCVNGICQTDHNICLCDDGWTNANCTEETTLIVTGYSPAAYYGGYLWIFGYFANIHNNLVITINGNPCTSPTITKFEIYCFYSSQLDQNGQYQLTVSQNNQTWSMDNYYSPSGFQCINGYYYSNYCYCSTGWIGSSCNLTAPIIINQLSPIQLNHSINGIYNTIGNGWFSLDNFNQLNFTFGSLNSIINIKNINSTYFEGSININNDKITIGYQEIKIYNITNNQLLFNSSNILLFYSNSSSSNSSSSDDNYPSKSSILLFNLNFILFISIIIILFININ